MFEENHQQEDAYLRAHMMGDIREDVTYLNLSLKDIAWIVGTTLSMGGFALLFPLPLWFKLLFPVVIFLLSTIGRYSRWPYRFRRWRHDARIKKMINGQELESLLGVSEDGWLYRSGGWWHMALRVQVPPWDSSLGSDKRKRLAGYESFLRVCANERIVVTSTAEEVPDFRWELWDRKESQPAATKGLQELKEARIARWKQLVKSGEALRSEYTLLLSIEEFTLQPRERDDEPLDLSKDALRRHRILAQLREVKSRVLMPLEQSDHVCTLLFGYAVAELVGRWWARSAWKEWQVEQRGWESDSEDEQLPATRGTDADVVDRSSFSRIGRSLRFIGLWVKELRRTLWKKPNAKRKQAVQTDGLAEMAEQAERPQADQGEVGSEEWNQKKVDGRRFSFSGRRPGRRTKTDDPPLTASQHSTIEVDEQSAPLSAPLNSETPPTPAVAPLPDVCLLTAPSSTGVSFLAANLAVSHAQVEPVELLDLSPDRGTLTLINPVLAEEDEYWQRWHSRNAPHLRVWTVQRSSPPSVDMVISVLQQSRLKGHVIVDMPWRYPGRVALQMHGTAVAIVDDDYHHWLQWEQAGPWDGEIWLNQDSIEMEPLIVERFGRKPNRAFPTIREARSSLYQGRPVALMPEVRTYFAGTGGIEHVVGSQTNR